MWGISWYTVCMKTPDFVDVYARTIEKMLAEQTENISWDVRVERQRWDFMVVVTGRSVVSGQEVVSTSYSNSHQIDKMINVARKGDDPIPWRIMAGDCDIAIRRHKDRVFGRGIRYSDNDTVRVFKGAADEIAGRLADKYPLLAKS